MYYLPRLIKKLMPAAIRDSQIDRSAKVEGGSRFISSSMGKYSYCGYDCTIINSAVGAFCSLGDGISIGLASHPLDWVSTSPAFFFGRDSIKKDLASKNYDTSGPQTVIENDVWIGAGAFLKSGVHIGNGAVIGMGSVVTKNIGPYEIWGGNPAKFIKKRFSEETIQRLLCTKLWNASNEIIKEYGKRIDNVEDFLRFIENESNNRIGD